MIWQGLVKQRRFQNEAQDTTFIKKLKIIANIR